MDGGVRGFMMIVALGYGFFNSAAQSVPARAPAPVGSGWAQSITLNYANTGGNQNIQDSQWVVKLVGSAHTG